MPTALILGVASQDGSYLAEFLLSRGYHIVGTVRKGSADGEENIAGIKDKITLENADLLEFDSISALVRKYTPDEFYNLAALTVPTSSWTKTYLVGQITGLGPVNSLEAIRQFSPKTRLFQATSREIFGSVASGIADENTPVHPENPYAIAKTYAHFMTQSYRKGNGLYAVSGILFNHESIRRQIIFITRKITTAAACLKSKTARIPLDENNTPILDSSGHLTLWDLDSTRDRGFAPDYVEAMWLMLQSDTPKDYIIATGSLHSVRDICKIAFSHVGLNWQDHIKTLPQAKVKPDTIGVRGDYSLIKKDLGWAPKTSFKQMIEIMVDSDLANFPS